MLSSYRPLICTYDLTSSHADKYRPFVVYISTRTYNTTDQQYEDIDTPIYTGKTWCSATQSGATTKINITDIVRNYAYRQQLVFDEDRQQWKPQQLGDYSDPLSHPTLVPVEHRDEPMLVNCDVAVDVGNPGSASRYVHSINTFLPTKDLLEYKNISKAYFDNNPALSLWYEYFTDVQPEYPYLLTNNYWVGCDFTTAYDKHDLPLELRGGTKSFALQVSEFGNFSTYIPLSQLFGELDNITGSTLYIALQDQKDKAFAKLDNGCFKDYYISWLLPTGAFFSYGFEDRHLTRSSNSDKETIQTLYDTERPVRSTDRYSFSLSRTVKKDVAKVLQTMGLRGLVYVYDVKQDRGDWCSVETSSFELGSNGLVDFSVDLKIAEVYQGLL